MTLPTYRENFARLFSGIVLHVVLSKILPLTTNWTVSPGHRSNFRPFRTQVWLNGDSVKMESGRIVPIIASSHLEDIYVGSLKGEPRQLKSNPVSETF